MDRLRASAALLDLGGVVYVGEAPLPGALEALAALRASGLPFRFLTNTTRSSRRRLLAKLARIGVETGPDALFTPAAAALAHLKTARRPAHLLIHPDLAEDFAQAPKGEPQAVVVGDAGEGFSYAAMNEAYRHLEKGAELIALARNKSFRDADGDLSLDAGPFVAALEYASGCEAQLFGKPSRALFEAACAAMGCRPEDAAMIGDDAESDVAGAMAAGLKAVLVQTGKYRAGDESRIDPSPSFVARDLGHAVAWLRGEAG